MAEESDLEKTEPASPRRLEQAREEGNVPQSRELSTFIVLMVGACTLWITSGWLYGHVGNVVREGLAFGRKEAFDATSLLVGLQALSIEALLALAPFFGVMMIAAVGAPALMGGLVISNKALEPKFDRLNPLSGIKRIFSWHGLLELVKGVLKATLIGGAGALVLWKHQGELFALTNMALEPGAALFGQLLQFSGVLLAATLFIVAGIDVPFQLWQYYDKLKMSKQDQKQEYKEQEGDPQIKSQIRARQREMSRRRMMEAVPKADVVVTNPTHYAVALKYEAGSMGAPTVVAKGADLIARNIRELAAEHQVPLLEAPPLARALYHHAEIGDQIPPALCTAVAEVMAYVYQLNQFIAEGGLPPEVPENIPVPAGLDPASRALTATTE
ncbi:MAG: flagellar biosynthesis protein FlhB [Candidatus Dactylopiibacterium carminicum]|nr:MAG: flagellar biosynthesis protein FlhB [Candidatus Dactylopiibacterium carminicum]